MFDRDTAVQLYRDRQLKETKVGLRIYKFCPEQVALLTS